MVLCYIVNSVSQVLIVLYMYTLSMCHLRLIATDASISNTCTLVLLNASYMLTVCLLHDCMRLDYVIAVVVFVQTLCVVNSMRQPLDRHCSKRDMYHLIPYKSMRVSRYIIRYCIILLHVYIYTQLKQRTQHSIN
jgi:hypothetical protein